jgi:5-keto-L-gluconate epimerase
MKISLTVTPNPVKFAPIVMCGPVSEAIKKAKTYGYDGVEIHLRDTKDIDRKEVKRLADDNGLEITTLGTGIAAFEYGINFGHENAGIRKKAVEYVRGYVELAAYLGSAVTIGIFSGRIGRGSDREERRKAAFECFKEFADTAAESGVLVLLEPLNRYESDYMNTQQEVMSVIKQSGFKNVKVLADTFHMNIEEVDICESLRKTGTNSLGYVHLVDSNRCGPGMGHIPMKEILKSLKEIDYNGFLSFECLPIPDVDTVLKQSINYVRDILKNI